MPKTVTDNKRCSSKKFTEDFFGRDAGMIRLLTAVVVIGICGFSVARGFGIVHFKLAMAKVDSPEARAEIANTWGAAPDVASYALRAALSERIDPSDQKASDRRRQTVSALVSIEPSSSYDWLSLSGLQLITDQPMEQVFDSLELSMLTGPHEGYVIAERRYFGTSLWERLPSDLKRRVASDVAAGDISESDPGSYKFYGFVAAQPEQVRNELREALVAEGLSPKEIENRLGF